MDQQKTSKARRRFTADFKASAVRLVLDEGRTIDSVVKDLGIARSSFCLWLRQARVDRGQGKAGELTSDERARLRELEKEVRVLKQERELLKKWVAFSAKEMSK
jgi:transposase